MKRKVFNVFCFVIIFYQLFFYVQIQQKAQRLFMAQQNLKTIL